MLVGLAQLLDGQGLAPLERLQRVRRDDRREGRQASLEELHPVRRRRQARLHLDGQAVATKLVRQRDDALASGKRTHLLSIEQLPPVVGVNDFALFPHVVVVIVARRGSVNVHAPVVCDPEEPWDLGARPLADAEGQQPQRGAALGQQREQLLRVERPPLGLAVDVARLDVPRNQARLGVRALQVVALGTGLERDHAIQLAELLKLVVAHVEVPRLLRRG